MGKRGPPKTPTAILKQRGSWRADTRSDEPQFDAGIPAPPAHLDAVAKKKWNETTPLLLKAGVLTKADADSLAIYCDTFSQYLRAKKVLEKEGDVYQGGKRAEVAIVEKCRETMLRFLREFGMTPASRSNVKVDTKAEDPDDELFKPRIVG